MNYPEILDLRPSRRFAFFMPTADGPCRFGVYNVLHRIVLEREGLVPQLLVHPALEEDFAGLAPGTREAVVLARA